MAKNEISKGNIDIVGILQIVIAVATAVVSYLEAHQEKKEVTNG